MTITEKVSYIRGLAEGLELDDNSKEVKVIRAMIDALDEIAASVTDLDDVVENMEGQLDEVDEDLGEVERVVYGDESDDEDDACTCGCHDEEDEDDGTYYEVTCPNCHESICLPEDLVEEGEMDCPNCGETLEFDLSDVEEDEEESQDTEKPVE